MESELVGEKRKMELDFDGLLQILAKNLYNTKDVFIRELIQNAHDACWRRHHRDEDFDIGQAAIDILPDLTTEPGRIVFRDNGEGMTLANLVDYLSTIGRSGTRAARDEAPETIGQFGIGFLSGFVVGSHVEVRTRHFSAKPGEALIWRSDGKQDYTIGSGTMNRIGTEVTITLKDSSERGFVSEEAVKKAIVAYADMLRIPIYINDPHHMGGGANTRTMPWEKEMSESERDFENRLFLERRVPDNVLEVIPVYLEDTQGLLYITKNRAIGTDLPRTMRLFVRRMHVNDNASDLLPPWASFVNGIINSTSIEPNAARDNFMRDDAAIDLQKRLGDCVIAHLEDLRERDPARLTQILRYQDLAIKAACHLHDDFFKRFASVLEWRVNPGSPLKFEGRSEGLEDREHGDGIDDSRNARRVTLPRLLEALPSPDGGGPKRLSFFSSMLARTQFFQIADATGTTVVDASFPYEAELLRTWAGWHDDEVILVRSGQVDDPSIFADLKMPEDEPVRRLAEYMSRSISPGGRGRVEVTARRIKPDSLASLLRDEEQSSALQKAYNMLNDANTSGELKRMAEEMIRMSRNAEMRMLINAFNPLVRSVAALCETMMQNREGRGRTVAEELMRGLYNSAILSNQRMLSAQNARIFYDQFQSMMRMIIDTTKVTEALSAERDALSARVDALAPARATLQRDYLRGFHITPFAEEFTPVRKAMRELVERHFGCELYDATSETRDGRIGANVKSHIRDADFFIVDITGPRPGVMNANAMIEFGAVSMARPDAPILPIARVAGKGEKFELPADIGELIYTPYAVGDTPEGWRAAWREGFEKDSAFRDLLAQRPVRYISAETIRAALARPELRGTALQDEQIRALCKIFPTGTAWRDVGADRVAEMLGGGPVMAAIAPLLISAIQAEAERR